MFPTSPRLAGSIPVATGQAADRSLEPGLLMPVSEKPDGGPDEPGVLESQLADKVLTKPYNSDVLSGIDGSKVLAAPVPVVRTVAEPAVRSGPLALNKNLSAAKLPDSVIKSGRSQNYFKQVK